MPFNVYRFIKMAVDFEMLRERKLNISDIASAFSDPKKGVQGIEKQEHLLEQLYLPSAQSTSSEINWDFNPKAQTQLKRWQR